MRTLMPLLLLTLTALAGCSDSPAADAARGPADLGQRLVVKQRLVGVVRRGVVVNLSLIHI